MPNEVAEVRPTTPLQLLQAAVERGVDPDKLGKLTDLVEKWEANRAKALFASAMNACQLEMPRVIKDADNGATKSRYVLLETLQDAIGPIYLKHGFALSWGQRTGAASGHTIVICTLYHTGGRSQVYEGEYALDDKGPKGNDNKTAIQGRVSAHTYAQRDMLRLMFNITIAGKDLDGNRQTDNGTIGPDEIATLNEGIEAAQENGRIREIGRFFVWCAKIAGLDTLDTLEDLPRSAYQRVKAELDQMRKAVKK